MYDSTFVPIFRKNVVPIFWVEYIHVMLKLPKRVYIYIYIYMLLG